MGEGKGEGEGCHHTLTSWPCQFLKQPADGLASHPGDGERGEGDADLMAPIQSEDTRGGNLIMQLKHMAMGFCDFPL